MAAAERFGGGVTEAEIHIVQAPKTAKGKVAGIVEGVYHADGASQSDQEIDNDVWFGLGPHNVVEKTKNTMKNFWRRR